MVEHGKDLSPRSAGRTVGFPALCCLHTVPKAWKGDDITEKSKTHLGAGPNENHPEPRELKPSVAERVLGPSQREQRLCSQL